MFDIDLFEIEGGWGYFVTRDGVAVTRQPYDPDKAGFMPMSKTRARAAAKTVIDRLMAADALMPESEGLDQAGADLFSISTPTPK